MIACLTLLLFPQFARAEGWVWMGDYPWIWSDQEQSWLYLWPAGAEGFDAWNCSEEGMQTIGKVPAIPWNLSGLSFVLTADSAKGVEPDVTYINILTYKTSYATIQLPGSEPSGTTPDKRYICSIVRLSSTSQMLVMRGSVSNEPIPRDNSYTLILNYLTDTSGTYFFNVPMDDETSMVMGTPTYTGTFVIPTEP